MNDPKRVLSSELKFDVGLELVPLKSGTSLQGRDDGSRLNYESAALKALPVRYTACILNERYLDPRRFARKTIVYVTHTMPVIVPYIGFEGTARMV